MNAPEGDRRWAALWSSDLVGFTRTADEIGQETAFALLDDLLARADRAVADHGGRIIDTAGDGFLAVFGAPRALETASLECCRAALAFHTELTRDAARLEARYGVRPVFRSGVSGGTTMVARRDTSDLKVVGAPVNEAARLQALASPGDILISEAIRHEIEGFADLEELGIAQLKGFDGSTAIYRLAALTETGTRFSGLKRRGLTAFISRDAEVEQALGALARAQPIAIGGAAGIGKSRLTHEIVDRLPDRRAALFGQCAPTDGSFSAIWQILRDAVDVARDTPVDQTAAALVAAGIDGAEELSALVGTGSETMEPSSRILRLRVALSACIVDLGRACVLVVEDAHWADPGTDAVLSDLSRLSLPLIVTHRPEYAAPWLTDGNAMTLTLGRLDDSDIARLVGASLADTPAPDLVRLVTDKSEGVPLVTEEILRALRLAGRLTRSAVGLSVSEGDGGVLTGNLEQLVLGRVDRLDPVLREALQVAVAIGREFPESLLDEALGRSADLAAIARSSDLIERSGPGRWRFAHALIRDAVYDGLLTGARNSAHARVAEALETSQTDAARAIADHWARADRPDRAIPAAVVAAVSELADYDLFGVDARLGPVFDRVEAEPALLDDETFGTLVATWLRALVQIGDFAKMLTISDRAMPRLQAAGYSRALTISQTLLVKALAHSRDYKGAEALGLSAQRDAAAQGDTQGEARAIAALVEVYDDTNWRDHDTLERMARSVIPMAEEAGDEHLVMSTLYQLSTVYRASGLRLKALETAAEIGAYAERRGNLRGRAYSAWARALIHCVDGAPEEALRTLDQEGSISFQATADASVLRGIRLYCDAFLQPPDTVLPQVDTYLDTVLRYRDYNLVHSSYVIAIIATFRAGRLSAGWHKLDAALAEADQMDHVAFRKQFRHLRAEVLLTLAGLIDPDAEAPPDRPRPPRGKPGWADMATYARLRPFAVRRASADLQACLSLERLAQGAHYARAQIGLGLIAMARGQRKIARTHLESGLAAATAEDVRFLMQRAQTGLARLGG